MLCRNSSIALVLILGGAGLAAACSGEAGEGTPGSSAANSGGRASETTKLPNYGYGGRPNTGTEMGAGLNGGTGATTPVATVGGAGGSTAGRSGLGGFTWVGIASGGTGQGGGAGSVVVAGATGGVASGGRGGLGGSGGAGGRAGAGGGAGASPFTGGISGTGSTTSTFWPGTYSPPSRAGNGQHQAGADCMRSGCHATGSRAFLFGGTVYDSSGTTAAANVQVGVSDGVRTFTAYSASNGNFWVLASQGTLDWSKATAHVRNAKGENIKPNGTAVGAGCNGNGCHAASNRIIAP